MKTARQKLRYLSKHFGFSPSEVASLSGLYEGKPFDLTSPAFARLQTLSAKLCDSYTALYQDLPPKAGLCRLGLHFIRRHRLLKQLFFDCPFSADIRPGFRCLIGQVDLLGTCYFGADVSFSPTSLVRIGKRSVLSPKASIGNAGFGLICLDEDSWIGAEAQVPTPYHLGKASVVAAGATLEGSFMGDFLIAYGRPAKTQELTGDRDFKQPLAPFSSEEKLLLVEHLRKLGFGRAAHDYERIIDGGVINVGSPCLGRLFLYSHALSYEYSRPETTKERKAEILRLLFPLAGKDLQVGPTLYVDLLGLVKLGEGVAIGDAVSFYGRVTIGDRVIIGERASFYATGHPLDYRKRRFCFSLPWPRSLTTFASILVQEGLSIGPRSLAAPFAAIEQSIPAGAIALPSGRIIL